MPPPLAPEAAPEQDPFSLLGEPARAGPGAGQSWAGGWRGPRAGHLGSAGASAEPGGGSSSRVLPEG